MSNKNTGALSGAGLNSLRYQTTFGTVGAIAEIVDNSIQWKQKKKDVDINIIFIERDGAVDEVLISDNGVGMGTVNGSEIIDANTANHWLRKSANQGNEEAKTFLKNLYFLGYKVIDVKN